MSRGALIVGGVIAGIAGLMIYLASGGSECEGGRTFRTLADCEKAGEPARLCRDWLADANRQLSRRGPFHITQEACTEAHVTCQRADIPAGFAPRAQGFCLIDASPERVVPLIPTRGG
jgi:uncharacterized protein YgiB involved in biofilm formation